MQTNHPLAKWIDGRMSDAEFARKVEVSKSHLSLVLSGKRGMSLDLAVKIEEATAGEFTAAGLLKQQKAMMTGADA